MKPTCSLSIVFAISFTLAACGGSDEGPGGDAAMDGSVPGDGSTDGPGEFDPSIDYPGEGDSCLFSAECGLKQLCLDDECVRHERITESQVRLGELRFADWSALDSHPLRSEASVDWTEAVGASGFWTLGWVAPGGSGQQLVFLAQSARGTPFREEGACQVGVLGNHMRILSIPDFHCEVANAALDGRVAVFGWNRSTRSHELVVFDEDDAEVFRSSIGEPEAWADVSDRAVIVRGTSLMFDGSDVLLSGQLGPSGDGRYPTYEPYGDDAPRTVGLLRFDPLGERSVVRIGESDFLSGWGGWILRSGAAMSLLVLQAESASVVDLSTGAETVVTSRSPLGTRYRQPSRDMWSITVPDDPYCTAKVVTPDGEQSYQWRGLEDGFDCADPDGFVAMPLDTFFSESYPYLPMPMGPTSTYQEAIPFVSWAVADGAVHLVRHSSSGGIEEAAPVDATFRGFYEPGWSLHSVSRYGMTVEGVIGTGASDAPFAWFEYTLGEVE